MKNFVKRVLVVMMVLLPCFQNEVFANIGEEPDVIPIKPKPGDPNPNDPNPGGPRSRARARYIIEVSPSCFFDNGEVSILAEDDITFINASVIRLDDNMEWSGTGIGNTLSFMASTEPGTYMLMLTLSNGKSYIGEYTLY